MNQLTVGQFKSKFSEVLEKILQGESVSITYGKSKKRVATLVPYKKYIKETKLKLGLLEGKASFKIQGDFKITDEEFLKS
ncbi:prevent-host-death protein [Candidatus Woesebacteria bacterium CG22_combo_CG10-13_8_21_14_all_39_10]|uniref:Prevent-host-death protein n=3 Tax=Patescibacteria group TaxID=1783273 RepID=A0A2M7D7W3_9BACT|nr:MAG: prevent-host-death protein [Candidatus Woesebacteria bacterium CG22_combo_CG10-13_8_21_14_all_39_10]PIV42597.1 MAG: prevent-host-death protein [Candidatus Nealsonbacteria bacterium CG02_land_8_20_14_3_00_40_11]PJA49764.1 MAG: prevent-host-death protein [Candidatus Shapirobacteria bacterium CG_4_9_14_3_um_filter_39_13]